jgi:hypothetical protein
MSGRSAVRMQVFAVVRFDLESRDPELAVTVKEVVPTLEEAQIEVARLNELVEGKSRVRYFWQATRFFPEGRHVEVGY